MIEVRRLDTRPEPYNGLVALIQNLFFSQVVFGYPRPSSAANQKPTSRQKPLEK